MGGTGHSSLSSGSERLRKVFPHTAYALEVVNAVPAEPVQYAYNLFLLAFAGSQREPTAAQIKRYGGRYAAKDRLVMRELKRMMSKERWGQTARDYVFEARLVPEKEGRYYKAVALRALLTRIAEQNETRFAQPNETENREHQEDLALGLPPAIGLLMELTISAKKYRIEPEPGLFKGMVDEDQLDRIKRCAYEKCRRFFWAARVDRPCCQESCRNAYKQKRHREREKRNRQSKKAMKGAKAND